MSVIKIPSKNIYQKDNQKVVDNIITKVEVSTNKPSVFSETGNVYDTRVSSLNKNLNQPQQDTAISERIYPRAQFYNDPHYYFNGVAADLVVEPYYANIKIAIPALQQNYAILSIFTGIDENKNSNIQYTVYGDIIDKTTDATLNVRITNTNAPDEFYVYGFATGDVITENIQEDIILDFSPYKNKISYSFNPPPDDANLRPITVSASIKDISNVDNQDFEINNDIYTATFTILCGIKIDVRNGSAYRAMDDENHKFTIPASGTSTEYRPKNIVMSFNGEKLTFNLTNKTVTIGSGKDVMSFSGNELVQETNTPSLETQYQAVINEWQKGKETATLRCSIDDYRDNDTGELVISANGNDTLPMTFKIGDIVIPYVYGANGQDKPMSVNLDGTAKKFVVVGTQPKFDGAVWQELTLQEKTN